MENGLAEINYKNTRTASKTIMKIKNEFSTIEIVQVEHDVYKDLNICLLSDGTRIPEKIINKLFNRVTIVPYIEGKVVNIDKPPQ